MLLYFKKPLLTLMCAFIMSGLAFSPAAGLDNLTTGFEHETPADQAHFPVTKGLETKLLQVENPLNTRMSTVGYCLASPQKVAICVFDHQGDEVFQLVESAQTLGFHHAVWNGCHKNGEEAQAGTYFLMMKTDESVFLRRLVLE